MIHTTMMKRTVGAAVVALAFLAAGCSDEDGDGATTDEEIGEVTEEGEELGDELEEEVDEGTEEVEESDG